MERITLVIPGLLPPPAAITETDLPACPSLQWVIGRADSQRTSSNYYRQLFAQFAVKVSHETDWPVASLGHLAEIGNDPGFCLRADPVHLSVGREGMVLIENAMLQVEAEEALSLAAELQPLFSELGASLVIGQPAHWYLRCSRVPALRTVPLDVVTGREVSTSLPTGAEQTRWRQLFNEIQMLLHECGVNQVRSRRRQLPINSLWFWGSGRLPAKGQSPFDLCVGDDPLVRGLACLHDVESRLLPADLDSLRAETDSVRSVLVVVDRGWHYRCYEDAPGWLGFLDQLERDWMMPLQTAIRKGELAQVKLILPGREFVFRRGHRWRFWRRASLLGQAGGS